jgi:hypothetical protein
MTSSYAVAPGIVVQLKKELESLQTREQLISLTKEVLNVLVKDITYFITFNKDVMMGRIIHSIIEQYIEGCDMSHSRKHHKRHHTHREHHKRVPTTYPTVDKLPVIPEVAEVKEKITHSHHAKSEAYSDNNRFFHQSALKTQGATQTTNVTVTVDEPQKDCLASCFGSLAKCFGKK